MKACEPIDLTALDPGIRTVVAWLRAHGFDTCDSGDGVSKQGPEWEGCAMPWPNVAIRVDPAKLASEADRLKRLLLWRGLTVAQFGSHSLPGNVERAPAPEISAQYCPVDGHAVLLLERLNDSMLASAESTPTPQTITTTVVAEPGFASVTYGGDQ